MNSTRFQSRLGPDLKRFLAFKRALGVSYVRCEFTLKSFDRHVAEHAPARGPLPLERLLRGWLARAEGRKAVTISMELAPVREFFRFRRRSDPAGFVPGREWAPHRTESHFVPRILTLAEVRTIVSAAGSLSRPPFRGQTFRALVLTLYCTGLRLGEAVRLRLDEVDLARRTLLVRESKGKTRVVPFGADLARELKRYRQVRTQVAKANSSFFVRPDGRACTTKLVSDTLRELLRRLGLKPPKGRVGLRPFDFRHAFAVHRLTRWYRAGVDLHARLPWLSAYMGHDDLLSTETYLTTTPELMQAASRRFAARLRGRCR
jgi:site-specific recombinase XerD